ncbi:hypothetical protein SDRG_00014 [Saprolegnia diclina VS20]|uniref:Uncharacterized protein n=1 Tax=Saprolegnia diclina (strain VS20) TaxID=1156394 RepID=T0R744_SAPDV|nr:hypothetical protein SDRG_00014 [Saprolegnia diclina VS20]EQC42275.1 hypothetical protein SDRG_00014 [Saprolegnia diclina VS20]|eukprot:XP_008603698.1 hypothetical protein SDRG_00014 [Saprolegnia diclina VS20]
MKCRQFVPLVANSLLGTRIGAGVGTRGAKYAFSPPTFAYIIPFECPRYNLQVIETLDRREASANMRRRRGDPSFPLPWRALVLMLMLALPAYAQVTIFARPGFVGERRDLPLGAKSSEVLPDWNQSISSVAVVAGYEFVTFDGPDSQGNMALWRYNTSVMGRWDRSVESFLVRASTESTALSAVTANWKCMEREPPTAPTLYMRVAIVPQSHEVGCFSTDAVNCVFYNTMADCAARITSVATLRAALCGATHMSFWGSTGYEQNTTWCSVAKAMFIRNATSTGDVPASFLWQCSPIKNSWIALRVLSPNQCYSTDSRLCTPFGTLDQCQASIQGMVDFASDEFVLTCSSIAQCVMDAQRPRETPAAAVNWPWIIAGVGLSLPVFCGLAAWHMLRKKPLPTNSHIFDTESTLCSSYNSERSQAI